MGIVGVVLLKKRHWSVHLNPPSTQPRRGFIEAQELIDVLNMDPVVFGAMLEDQTPTSTPPPPMACATSAIPLGLDSSLPV
mmetsp:Transcript_79575/g.110562  ORF Transcript_79575/g.110562 Transcript_79575/m.110562 type:complete len:81 (+) Transcript_79575:182-424(+)